eukprot:2382686-Rhodomonas_salina.3
MHTDAYPLSKPTSLICSQVSAAPLTRRLRATLDVEPRLEGWSRTRSSRAGCCKCWFSHSRSP